MRKKGFFRRTAKCVLYAGLLAVAFLVFFAADIFDIEQWHELEPERILGAKRSLIIYDRNGSESSVLYVKENRQWVDIESLQEHTVKAFLSAEDARFYDHRGVDIIRIGGAALHDIRTGSLEQGASTITQQLIKLSHLTGENEPAEKTISRKLEEAVLAIKLESIYSKEQIMEMYLNYVYFGGGYYGIEAAAKGYFGIPSSELSAAQSALLAGILKSPTNYAPHLDLEASVGRRNVVLSQMKEYGHISESEYERYKNEAVVLHDDKTKGHRSYYIDLVIDEACALLGTDSASLFTEGWRIYTYLDSELQTSLEAVFENDELFPTQSVQAAGVVLDTSSSGILAVVGGRGEYTRGAFNRATDMKRQPGSVIKPILVYAPALESFGYTAASMILDEPTSFGTYNPQNAGNKYYGWVTMRQAVTRSLNVPAVKLMSNMGIESCKLFAGRLGIDFSEDDAGLALALGGFTYGVSPLQLSAAYASFASEGVYKGAGTISRIEDSEGNTVYERNDSGLRVMSAENAYILTSMLRSAVTEGTGRRLGQLGIPVAGKTGTVGDSNSTRDAWMSAYNPEYSVTVWLGYDTNEEALPSDATGGRYPAAVIYSIFDYLYPDKGSAPDFIKPHGIKEVRLDAYSLEKLHTPVLATAFTPNSSVLTELFTEGTAPVERSTHWNIPAPPNDLSVTPGEYGMPLISFTAEKAHICYELYRLDMLGNELLIDRWQGEAGRIEYCDMSAEYGMVYAYYVVPVHTGITVSGQYARGAASLQAFITMPEPPLPDEP